MINAFYSSRGGVSKHLVNYAKPLPTATHSWGSQVKGCQCGCRVSGFSADRLETRGLYGQIFPIKGTVDMGGFVADCMRHMHRAEVALANGIRPQLVGTSGFLRLELAGVGQCASPIQSLWVYSNLLCNVYDKFGITVTKTPVELLKEYGKELFEARDQLLQISAPKTKYMKLFEEAWENLGESESKSNPLVDEKPPGDSFSDFQGIEKGEPTRPSIDHDSPPKAASVPLPFQKGQSPKAPTDDASLHSLSAPKRKLEIEAFDPEINPDAFDAVLLQHVKEAEIPDGRHNQRDSFGLGGVPGFESSSHKRQRVAWGEIRVVPNNRDGGSHPVTTQEVEEDGQLAKKERDTASVYGDGTPTGDSHLASAEIKQSIGSTVFVSRPGQPIELVKVRGEIKGRQLLDASMDALDTECILQDAMGNPVDPEEQCQDGQILLLEKVPSDASAPPNLMNDSRTVLLWQQKGWEKHEMQFYLKMIESRFTHQVHQAFSLPENPSAGVSLGTYILDMAQEATLHQAEQIATCILSDHHWEPLVLMTSGDMVEIHTSEAFAGTLKSLCAEFWDDCITIVGSPIPQVFKNDCGFQSLGWIERKLLNDQTDCTFTPHKAVQWRWEYHEHLIQQQEDHMIHKPLERLKTYKSWSKNMECHLQELQSVQPTW